MSQIHLSLLLIALGVALAAAAWFAWRAKTVAGFVAGTAAAAVVGLDDVLLIVVTCAVIAAAVGGSFALRTVGVVSDDGSVSSGSGRLGAAWLVLSFPAAVTWASLIGAHWMLHRV